MKRTWILGFMVMLFLGISGPANAALTVIGAATYQGNDYNLIYMDDGPFGPITWLDYSKDKDTWQNLVDWASGLSFAEGDIQLEPGVTSSIDWTTGWRLPGTDESRANLSKGFGYQGPNENGYHDYRYGYNMVNSEMGHLYYQALGNKGYWATDGTWPQPGWGLTNIRDFEQLQASYYRSGTEYSNPNVPDCAWYIRFDYGRQDIAHKSNNHYALAVRPGEVTTVPIPGAVLLLASGLAGLFGISRKFGNN